ncbi:MAG TPA: zinc-binding dehydrogenase [Solirubrobacterales bacterium]|nr:zinc-binding dehydrogenase [Solirubrobacterales bacterium]
MKALVPRSGAQPSVELAEVEEPRPREDELLVAVEAFSVNRGETFLLERPPSGWRPGKDVVGTVVEAATCGGGPRVGERVVGHPEARGWAERVAIPLAKVAPLPADVDSESAAALPLAGLTALRLARAAGPLGSRRVLLTGASGGVGHYFVELAAAQGAAVTAVSAAGRGERLRELGAVAVVEDVEQAEGPFDVGLDSVGGASTGAVLRRLRDDGLLVWFGQASREVPRLDFFDWSGGANATIRKFHYAESDVSDGEDLATLVRLLAADRLHPEIGLRAEWTETADAISALLARQVRGNAVLTVSSSQASIN